MIVKMRPRRKLVCRHSKRWRRNSLTSQIFSRLSRSQDDDADDGGCNDTISKSTKTKKNDWIKKPYKKPSPNIKDSTIFLRVGILSRVSSLSGSAMITRFEIIENAAVEYQLSFTLMQNPETFLSQNLLIGVHWKTVVKTDDTQYPITITTTVHVRIRNGRAMKILR